MLADKRLSAVFQSAVLVPFDATSKIIIMSDCHRGDGSWADDFSNNRNIYFSALSYYYRNGYTYIELGDGDELWENRRFSDILRIHRDVFWLISEFFRQKRFYAVYGNHDMMKRDPEYVRSHFFTYFHEREKKELPLFENIAFHEGILLQHMPGRELILLTHGHQADFANDTLWRVSRFLVRYVWRYLELIGIRDPTSTAKNYTKKETVEKILVKWAEDHNQMMIAGHTHRPVFPREEKPLYFNDGSCVHPRCITGIEIARDSITLVKWCIKTKEDGTLYVAREILEGPRKLEDCFRILRKDGKPDSVPV